MESRPLRGSQLALHACCGPCLIEPLDAYLSEGATVVAVYANPNIHPAEEYVRRRDTLTAYAALVGTEVAELEYEPARWDQAVAEAPELGIERCRACYRLRLAATARWAATHGFDAMATTLTVSPYQDPEVIREEGLRAASEAGIAYVHRDFRGRYPEATRRSREQGMYRQNYCGCVCSESEARAEREQRKAARQSARGAL
jgi:epoxyqueuosine reductase